MNRLFILLEAEEATMTTRLILSLTAVVVFSIAATTCGSGNHLVSVTVTPNPANINAPGNVQLKAVETFSDGMTKVLAFANWTSSSQDVTVTNYGLATCALIGGPTIQVTITAATDSASGYTTLYCTPLQP